MFAREAIAMETVEQIPPKKDTTWIWVVVAAVLVCVCCVAVILAGGAIYYLTQGGLPAGITIPGLTVPTEAPTFSPLPQPNQPSATLAPPVSGPIVIVPYIPASGDNYPALVDLALGWESQTAPGTMTWPVSVNRQEQVLIIEGWCTADTQTLDQNFQHITYLLEVDGRDVPVNSLYLLDHEQTDMFCRSYLGIIRQWPAGEHTISTTMHLDEAINDGWDDYMAGDYTDEFRITVTP